MKVHAIIHAPFEKLGAIEAWVNKKGYTLTSTHTYQGEKLPTVSDFDFLIVMGGPQSPLELDKYPYLRDEINLTKQAIQNHKAILGICLGAQIIGESYGATTERSPNKEVGVFSLKLTSEGRRDPIFKTFPEAFDVMHWHNDMPGITSTAVLLASSEGCPRQVIRYSDRVYGLQCHMEMTIDLIQGMLEHCPGDLNPSQYTQTGEAMLAANHAEINKKMWHILDGLASMIK